MNLLTETIRKKFPDSTLSCRDCGGSDSVKAIENNQISISNPLGDREMVIYCSECGLTDKTTDADKIRETVKAWLIQEVRNYICTFEFHQNTFKTSSSGGLADFSNGFWVTKPELKFTKGSDAAYWVPPGRIYYVAVETVVKRLSE